MAKIVSLHGPHKKVFDLLPWYVTGQLDPGEQAEVEAHLSACADCQDEVTLQRALSAELKTLPVGVEDGWERMLQRLESEERDDRMGVLRSKAARAWRAGGPWLGWAAAACLALTAGALISPAPKPASYRALGAAPANTAGDVMVVFRPDTSEQALRHVLETNHLRMVDGPTASGAYVLHSPAGGRAAALAVLKGRPEVLAAAAIDPSAQP